MFKKYWNKKLAVERLIKKEKIKGWDDFTKLQE